MKKMNNKGFSLVELIIVIAIMAILAGAIAPALIRYIDKSRRSNDVSSCDTIETSVNTALGNESISEYLTSSTAGTVITLTPAGKFGSTTGYTLAGSNKAIALVGNTDTTWKSSSGKTIAECQDLLVNELGQSLNGTVPKLKYKKDAKTNDAEPSQSFYVYVSPKGSVEVYIGESGKEATFTSNYDATAKVLDGGSDVVYEICPEVCDSYQ